MCIALVIDLLNEDCAFNDSHGYSDFDVDAYSAKDIMVQLKKDDQGEESWGMDCSEGRIYSKSKLNGAELYDEFLASDDGYDVRECFKDSIPADTQVALQEIVSDPANMGVFASLYGANDNPEGCSYFKWDIYRPDGLKVSLEFNFTD